MKQLLLFAFLALFIGCKNLEDTAYKVTGTTAITADAAMSEWLDYKNTHTVPDTQVQAVKRAWNIYYNASQSEKNAVIAFKTTGSTNALAAAVAAVSASSSDLIGIIVQFLPASNVAKLKGVK
jgi:hypothetical protein